MGVATESYKPLFHILQTEYGIMNKQQLDKAVKRLGGLDITRFCIRGEDSVIKKEGEQFVDKRT